ncbi:MAG: class I SAM-dependent methyltransferase [Bradymonadaceae bacterium]
MKPGRLLDVGCGSGAYLRDMEALGWQVAGVDISPEAIKCATRDGYNAKVGTLFSAHLEEESFDLITMWHVLEHFHRPVDMLRRAHDILRPNGRLILAVPNWRSIMRQIGGDAWWCLEVPRHLHHFTPETLRKTLTTAGFEVSLLRPKVRPRMVVGTLGMKFPSLNGGSTLKNRILEAAVFPFELAAASGLRSDTIWAVATRK